jgi:O-antigen/teichoic acid export membrane protein
VLGALVIYLSRLYIGRQELGLRENLVNQTVASAQILLLGLHNTLAVYIHRYPDGDPRKKALMTLTMVVPFLCISIASVAYVLLKVPIVSSFKPFDQVFIARYFLWVPVFTLLFAYQVLLETYLVSQLKVAKAIFIREIVLRLANIGFIFLYGFHLISFDAFVASTVLIYLLPIAMLALIARGTKAWSFTAQWATAFEPVERRELVHFTWYHSLYSVSATLLGTVDVLMLAALSSDGLRSVAVYVLAVFLMSLLQIPYKAMLQATLPVLAQAFAVEDMAKVKDIFSRSSQNIFIASVAMWLLIVSNLHNAVAIMPAGYEAITSVVFILSAGKLADLATGMNDQVLSISKHYKINFYISLLLVALIIGFNLVLIPRYNIYGAAWASSGAMVIYNFLKYFIVRRKLGLVPFGPGTPLVLMAGAATWAFGYCLPRIGNPFLDVAYRSALIVVYYGGLIIWLKPSPDIAQYLTSVRQQKRLF